MMDVAANFMLGIWVDAVDMATVRVGIGFMGADIVGVVGKGWAITLTVYLLFPGTLVLLFFSAILGPGIFLFKELLFLEGVVVCGCDWVNGLGLGLGLSLPSNSRYVFIFQTRKGKGQSLVLRGLPNITCVV